MTKWKLWRQWRGHAWVMGYIARRTAAQRPRHPIHVRLYVRWGIETSTFVYWQALTPMSGMPPETVAQAITQAFNACRSIDAR